MDRSRIAIKGSIVGIILNSFLAIAKIFTGLSSGSMAILGDGLDSSTDILTSFITLASTKLASKPPDREHPYGHERAETVASKLVSMIIFFAGGQLAIGSIRKLFSGAAELSNLWLVLIVALVSILGKFFLYRYKMNIGKKIDSQVFIADALNMRSDIMISLSVFIGILIVFFTGLAWLDALTGLLVSIVVLKTAINLFLETSNELMDGIPPDAEVYSKVFEAIENIEGVSNPHKVRIRKMGYKYLVDLDIEVAGEMTVSRAHELAKNVEIAIIDINEKIYDVHVHIEPAGNVENENYGISSNRELK